ncbi:Uncharacterised protein [Mycobacteroides abscessus subsp. abscessus]|nr:Uncharacterised protein [Mycobacteroides abscessus subsp. abscessus]SLC89468.1 Uncharacterised protein [Mycobacteroides abscessus subsp. abscessus]
MVSLDMPAAPDGHHWAVVLHNKEVEVQLIRTEDMTRAAHEYVEYAVMGRNYDAPTAVVRGANIIAHRATMAQRVFDELGVIATMR